ncbi:hypothetical protein U9M48_012737 [Paspalum notatum var. saurae]|uniref:Tf2-1-like SH3-like domain-containing protein n=1 Tax=Paspalum notatum var. saurae TaxID=547442 RepID=A0AAQ3WIP8_PASNO
MAKQNYDRGHRDLSFAVGDWVWLRLRHHAPASLQVAKGKLRPRYYGPYRISSVVNSVAYKLELPPCARIHDVFHVGALKRFIGEPPTAPPALPPLYYGAVIQTLARTVCMRLARGVSQVLVQWADQPASAATWEDVDEFQRHYPQWQLEGDLLLEGGRDVMWGRHYSKRQRPRRGSPQEED